MHFVSADTIAPGEENPQKRNRYAYVLNNPINHADPSGHCVEDGSDGENTVDCEKRIKALGTFGISIIDYASGQWSLAELTVFLQGAQALLTAMGWTFAQFNRYVGPVHASQSSEWQGTALVGSGTSALSVPNPKEGFTNTTFYQGSIKGMINGRNIFLETVVHELAHAMDFMGAGGYSLEMMRVTGSSYRDPTPDEIVDDLSHGRSTGFKYVTTGTTLYGSNNHVEDWAESVASYTLDRSRVNPARLNYIGNLYGNTGIYGGGGGAHGAR